MLLSRATFCFRQNISLILFLIAIELLVPIFYRVNAGTNLVLYFFVIFFFHRTILIGSPTGRATRADPRLPERKWPEFPRWRLWLALILLGLIFVGLIFLFASLLRSLAQTQNLSPDAFVGLAVLPILMVYWLLLSVFGTVIPAATLNYRTSLGEVLSRARHSFFFIASRLLIGPGLLGALMLTGLLYVHTTELLPGWNNLADITQISALIELSFGFMSYFIMCLTAAILSEWYLRALGPVDQDSATQ